MATLDPNHLLELMERRWDYHSARAVQHEMLSQLGLEGRPQLAAADVERMIAWLERSNRRADAVIAGLRAFGGAPAAKPAPAPVAAPAPAPVAAPAPAPVAAPAPAPAAPSTFDVKVGGPAEVSCPPGALVRIVSDRAGTVRWGVSGWKRAPAEVVPAGSAPGEGETTDSKLVPAQGAFELRFGKLPATLGELNFVVRFEDNTWTKDAKVKLA